MVRYKIIVAYDGTDYFGWQRQKGPVSIVGTLEETFFSVFNRKICILGASRTDAGVHALGQVATFDSDLEIPEDALHYAWNRILPETITIRSLEKTTDNYNPHHHVHYKTYQYLFFQKQPLPIHARYGWYYHYSVDIEKLKECLSIFIGTHDFRSFCTGDDHESTVRTIQHISVDYDEIYKGYRITIQGPGFLRYMIRRIVGACLHVASRDTLGVIDIQQALAACDPEQQLPNAPAKGLTLIEINYFL